MDSAVIVTCSLFAAFVLVALFCGGLLCKDTNDIDEEISSDTEHGRGTLALLGIVATNPILLGLLAIAPRPTPDNDDHLV